MSRNEKTLDEIPVTRGRLGSISVYEVTADELDILEHGSPNSTYLNFALVLIPTGVTFFISILSTKIEDTRVYLLFWVLALVTTIIGAVLLIVWLKTNKDSYNVMTRIKSRIQPQTQLPPEGEVEQNI